MSYLVQWRDNQKTKTIQATKYRILESIVTFSHAKDPWMNSSFKYHNMALHMFWIFIQLPFWTFSLNYLNQMLVQHFLLPFCISFLLFLVVVFDIPVACLHGLSWNKCYLGT